MIHGISNLWGCSTVADHTTDSNTLGLVIKVGGWGEKSRKKGEKNLGWFLSGGEFDT